jgi:two-component system LytT family response regulator
MLMDKARIILVDDNEDSLEIIQFYIEQIPGFQIVDKCSNGEELIESILRTNPDVIFLDINMPKVSGIEAMRTCLNIRSNLLFIFITGYEEFAVKAFELNALDYIVKPIEKSRLYSALEKVNKIRMNVKSQDPLLVSTEIQRLTIKNGLDYYYIPINEIIFIEKVGTKCHIHTYEKTFITNDKIGNISTQLPSTVFFMSHRSYIINLGKLSHVLAKNQTYLAYFSNTNKHAHVSKLKIEELHSKINPIN